MKAKIKQEQMKHVFKQLKCKPLEIIELDSLSPVKHSCCAAAINAPPNPSTLPGLQTKEEDIFSEVGQEDGLEAALEEMQYIDSFTSCRIVHVMARAQQRG